MDRSERIDLSASMCRLVFTSFKNVKFLTPSKYTNRRWANTDGALHRAFLPMVGAPEEIILYGYRADWREWEGLISDDVPKIPEWASFWTSSQKSLVAGVSWVFQHLLYRLYGVYEAYQEFSIL
ncbi:hypothetical protein [Microbulbifer taiwanensis]|uniref:hypothetical protein n=1 Tax=Microbulbifer taiwanensis TaxID=986746 RepID=UPI003609083F